MDVTNHPSMSRRAFLGGAAGAAVAAGVLGDLPDGLTQALAEPSRPGRLNQVEHVVILMQENRSFDHYYGTMRGVRGYGDRAALTLANGNDVFHQPDPSRTDGGYLLPFHVDTSKVDGQDLADLDHSWATQHAAVGAGAQDGWVPAKGEETMGFFAAADLPFHRALAGAFTLCDHYFCSIQGPTTPNRLYHWTGTIDPTGVAGGPATFNPDDYNPVYHWTTYPERLQQAGVSWQVYANREVGDGADGYVGDYGDNPLWLFQAYHDAMASSDPKVRQLADRANVILPWLPDSGQGTNVDHVLTQFTSACASGNLPQVSWVVAPYRYSEHPAARPVDGAAYTQTVLTALWQNPKLWESTVLLINFDENDGFFDHVIPPVSPAGTPDEQLPIDQVETPGNLGTGPLAPIGLGTRVPMTVISPWSRGGWINSQVFDHTSVLRFLETWTGVAEPNISAWRRSICGDLTSCFDFTSSNRSVPTLPNTATLQARADQRDPSLPAPTPPAAGQQVTPTQEPGSAPARALPYQPAASVSVGSAVDLQGTNLGTQAIQLAVFARHLGQDAPTPLDVGPASSASLAVPTTSGSGAYDLAVHAANGFVFLAAGDATSAGVEIQARISSAGGRPVLVLVASNASRSVATVRLADAVSGAHEVLRLRPGQAEEVVIDALARNWGWYDVSATADGLATWSRRFAGHLEDGQPSRTG